MSPAATPSSTPTAPAAAAAHTPTQAVVLAQADTAQPPSPSPAEAAPVAVAPAAPATSEPKEKDKCEDEKAVAGDSKEPREDNACAAAVVAAQPTSPVWLLAGLPLLALGGGGGSDAAVKVFGLSSIALPVDQDGAVGTPYTSNYPSARFSIVERPGTAYEHFEINPTTGQLSLKTTSLDCVGEHHTLVLQATEGGRSVTKTVDVQMTAPTGHAEYELDATGTDVDASGMVPTDDRTDDDVLCLVLEADDQLLIARHTTGAEAGALHVSVIDAQPSEDYEEVFHADYVVFDEDAGYLASLEYAHDGTYFKLATGVTGGDCNDFVVADWSGSSQSLSGGQGHDILLGFVGNDTLLGGEGNDLLVGGAGIDTFVFDEVGAANMDHIADFTVGTDHISLSFTGSLAGVTTEVDEADGSVTLSYNGQVFAHVEMAADSAREFNLLTDVSALIA